jgi:hypothetical protein
MRAGKNDRFEKMLRRLLRGGPGRRRPTGKRGGSEAVAVEPDHPRRGEGGAAAALEFDEPA